MKHMVSRALAALFLFAFCANATAGELPKREFRGGWIHIVGNYSMTSMNQQQIKNWFTTALDSLQSAGCNAVIFQVRPQADAFYISDLEPWTRFMTGTQGKAPSPLWDPLEFIIEEAHNRGMELHAWLNPYRVTSTDKEVLCKDHLYFKRPDLFVKYGKQLYFDPGEPDAIEHTVKVITDIVTRYDVDAVHFDDYFYPYPIAGQDFPDDKSFEKYAAAQGFTDRGDWRRNNVTTLIRRINESIKAVKPWIRFGVAPFGIHRNIKQDPNGSKTNGLSNYDELFADVTLWCREGYVDYNVPQLYWKIGHPKADFETLIHWWNDGNFGGHLYIGEHIISLNEPDLENPQTNQMAAKMKLSRTLPNVHGNVWWPGWNIEKNVNNIADSLRTKYQKYPALIPVYDRLDSTAPQGVSSFKAEISEAQTVLKWDVTPTDDPMQQPGFYVVYRFPEGAEINLGDSQYIYSITRKKEQPVCADDRGATFIVTVTDHCWNESAPSAGIVL
ncbi:MAG: family 10 glycosylhydrolase [Bacteroidales bacterium]|nr:family 10 glycosylhydrolase [Bacteroidales bacterium]